MDPEIQYQYYGAYARNNSYGIELVSEVRPGSLFDVLMYGFHPSIHPNPTTSTKSTPRQDTAHKMDRAVPRCASLIHSCQNAGATACALARVFCTARILDYFPLKERNIYDIRGECKKPPLCYDFDNVESFLKRPEVLAVRACSGGGRGWGRGKGRQYRPSCVCLLGHNTALIYIHTCTRNRRCTWHPRRAPGRRAATRSCSIFCPT